MFLFKQHVKIEVFWFIWMTNSTFQVPKTNVISYLSFNYCMLENAKKSFLDLDFALKLTFTKSFILPLPFYALIFCKMKFTTKQSTRHFGYIWNDL